MIKIGFGLSFVTGALLCVLYIKKLGCRLMLITGYIIECFCLLMLTLAFLYNFTNDDSMDILGF